MKAMPTLCANAGSLPEAYRPFLNAQGELQCGDALGFEAQWIIGAMVVQPGWIGPYFPECEWSRSQIEEDARTIGCHRCGSETVPSEYHLCEACRELDQCKSQESQS